MIKNMSDNVQGAFFMALCMAGFGLNDALMKLASEHFSLTQAMFMRSVITTFLLGLYAWRKKVFLFDIPKKDRFLILLRIIGEVVGSFLFLTAIFNMPLANATAILQSTPLVVTLGAAIFLNEPVGWRRYLAVLIGFAAVMIIVRPGAEGFNSYSFFAVSAVGLLVLRDLSTRRISKHIHSSFVSFLSSGAILLVTAAMLPFTDWAPLSFENSLLILGAALFVLCAYILSVSAMRIGEIGFVSPFRYTILLWSILLGVVVFGDYPDFWTIVGSSIVVVTGLYTFYREQKMAKRQA